MNTLMKERTRRALRVIKILLMTIAALVMAFSFSSLGSQPPVQAATTTYMDDNGNWKGGTATDHDTWLKDQVNSNWISADFASQVPADAKGTDQTTGKPYIDEWLPDKNLQKLVVHDLGLSSVSDITKDNLNQKMGAYFYLDSDLQHYNRTYYNQVCNTKSLEGLQYATQLTDLEFTPDQDASLGTWGVWPHGRLSDISALKQLTELTHLNIQLDDVYDISPIAGKKLDSTTSMSYNHIIDASPLESSKDTLGTYFTFAFQSYKLPTITLNSKVTSYTTPSFVIKNVEGANVPVKPYYATGDPNPNFNNHAKAYKSTADGGPYSDPAKPTVTWTNLTQNNTINHGYMTVTWEDPLFGNPSYTYQGWVIQPYQISDTVGNVNVNFKNADNGQYIYGQQTLSGNLGDKWNLSLAGDNSFKLADTSSTQNQNIQSIIDILKEQNDFNTISVSSPTVGEYQDTTPVPTVTYTFSKKAVPVVAEPVTVKYVDEDGERIAADQVINGNVGDEYDTTTAAYRPEYMTQAGQLYQLDKTKLPDNAKGTLGTTAITVAYTYQKVPTVADNSSVIVNYIDEATNGILKSQTLHGKIGDRYQADGKYRLDSITANGYTYDLNTNRLPENVTGNFTENTQFVNYYYRKRETPVTPIPPTPPTPNPEPTPQPTPEPTPMPEPDEEITTTEPSTVAKKGEAASALKKIYLYKNATFKKSERLAGYVMKPRVYRPMFVVTGYKKSKNGNLRYQVRDVNHLTKNRHLKGYITAKYSFVRPVYYQSTHKVLTVINPKGVNGYKNVNLTGKIKNYRQGTKLRVYKVVHHNLTTRYVLKNGQYITGNRKLVNMNKQKQPKYAIARKAINRYETVNLTKRNRHIKRGTKLLIKNYDFSRGNSVTKHGTMRLHVKGGYITANKRLVKIVY